MSNKFSIREHVDDTFSEHVFVPAPSQSFSFFGHSRELKYVPQKTKESSLVSRSSFYSFEITWRPGHIILTGDLGELTLVQKFAMPTFKEAMEWVVDADYEYLMSKTGVKKTYDADATYKYLIHSANREAIEHLLGHSEWSPKENRYIRRGGVRADVRRYRAECKEATVELEKALSEYALGDQSDESPKLEDFLPYEEEFGSILRTRDWETEKLSRADYPDVHRTISRTWDVCGYETWVSFWVALETSNWYDPAAKPDDQDAHPTFVLNPRNRQAMKDQIKELCYQQHEIIEFLTDAGFSDYYGSDSYPSSSKWQIDAVKHGCKMLLDKIIADEQKAA
jgi:hypothetical protein